MCSRCRIGVGYKLKECLRTFKEERILKADVGFWMEVDRIVYISLGLRDSSPGFNASPL